ncbi:hypothetical protein RUM43_011422 [Polyplax serrata]|uniref:Uncharacterized protein n=1 Tax=Polyplax serrata TaxID=468196 RepID=A0AAN8NTQ4_POLSC
MSKTRRWALGRVWAPESQDPTEIQLDLRTCSPDNMAGDKEAQFEASCNYFYQTKNKSETRFRQETVGQMVGLITCESDRGHRTGFHGVVTIPPPYERLKGNV